MAIIFKTEKERLAFLRSKYEEIPIKSVEEKEEVKPKKKETKKKNDKKLSE